MSDLTPIVEQIKNGEKAAARAALLQILQEDPANEQAWLYLAACAQNKQEYEISLHQTLTLNPSNAQALALAARHDIPLPDEAQQLLNEAQKRQKKGRRNRGKSVKKIRQSREGRTSPVRIVLLLLLVILLASAAIFFSLGDGDDTDDSATVAEIIEATATPTDAPTETPTPEPTEIAEETAEATEEATETPTATPEPTEEPTEAPTATTEPEPTAEAPSSNAEAVIAPLDNPADTIQEVRVMAGSGDSPAMLDEKSIFLSNEMLNVVLDVAANGDDVELLLVLRALETVEPLSVEITQTIEAGEARSIVIPLTPDTGGDLWTPNQWAVQLQVDGQSVDGLVFAISPDPNPPTPTVVATDETSDDATLNTDEPPTPAPETASDAIEAAPISPDTSDMAIYWDDNSIYFQNISGERILTRDITFVQTLEDGSERGYAFSRLGDSLFAEGCFQLATDIPTASSVPPDCQRLDGWQVASVANYFWLVADDGTSTFSIFREDEFLTECNIAAGQCGVTLMGD